MTKAVIVLLIIIGGFIAGPLLSGQTGYVMIAIAGYTIETSLVVLILALLLLLLLVWLLDWAFKKVRGSAQRGLRWSAKRKAQKAQQLLQQSTEDLTTGAYEAAQQHAEDALRYVQDPLMALSIAAHAAKLQGDVVSEQKLLERIQTYQDDASLAYELAQARRAAPERSVKQMQELLQRFPQHLGVQRQAAEVFFEHRAGNALYALMPALERSEAFTAEHLNSYQVMAYQGYFGKATDATEAHQLWRGIDASTRKLGNVRVIYVQHLQRLQADDIAARVLVKGLRKGYLTPAHILHAPVTLKWHHQYEPLADFIQDHLKHAPQDVDALALLATIAIDQGDHELALRAVKAAVQVKPNNSLYRLLGDAHLAAGQSEPALAAYRQAAK